MPTRQKAVIFDYSTLLINDAAIVSGLQTLLQDLKARGIRIVGFSTHNRPLQRQIAQMGLPALDLFVTQANVGNAKGDPAWITFTAGQLGVQPHELFYIGDDALDWRTAINAGTFYLHAAWAKAMPSGVTALAVQTPAQAHLFLTHFFLPDERWGYKLDNPQQRLRIRSLLNATCTLTCDPPHNQFTLQDVFTYANQRQVGGSKARDILMLHAIANLYAEGLIDTGTRFAVYPSSTPGQPNPALAEFLDPVAKFFHGWLKEGILTRAAQAPDTSRLRASGNRGAVTILNQTNTVLVDPTLLTHVQGRNVIVFDDFTTSGMSLDWARTLIYAAGAQTVTLVTIGKYGRSTPLLHKCFDPNGIAIDPFQLFTYLPQHFIETSHPMIENGPGMRITQDMFQKWVLKQPF